MDVARMKKALVAAGTAAGGAFVLGLFTEIPQTGKGWVALIGGSLVVGITAGRITYNTRNEGPGLNANGSDDGDAEYEAFKAAWDQAMKNPAWDQAMKNPQAPRVLDDGDGPLSPGDRRG